MRISDWNSDVCSSDLATTPLAVRSVRKTRDWCAWDALEWLWTFLSGTSTMRVSMLSMISFSGIVEFIKGKSNGQAATPTRHWRATCGSAWRRAGAGDRKSVAWGQSVSVRVDLGGRRIIKKKIVNNKRNSNTEINN